MEAFHCCLAPPRWNLTKSVESRANSQRSRKLRLTSQKPNLRRDKTVLNNMGTILDGQLREDWYIELESETSTPSSTKFDCFPLKACWKKPPRSHGWILKKTCTGGKTWNREWFPPKLHKFVSKLLLEHNRHSIYFPESGEIGFFEMVQIQFFSDRFL